MSTLYSSKLDKGPAAPPDDFSFWPAKEEGAMKRFSFSDSDEKKLDHTCESERATFHQGFFRSPKGHSCRSAESTTRFVGREKSAPRSRKLCITDDRYAERKEH
jgi:hypothetical protein